MLPTRELRQADLAQRTHQFGVLAVAMMRKGDGVDAAAAARHAGGNRAVVELAKAGTPGMLSSTNEALVDLGPLVDAFLVDLQAWSVFDRLLPRMLPGVLHAPFGLITSAGNAGVVEEGAATAATRMAASTTSLTERRVAALVALSKQVAASRLAPQAIARGLLEAAARAVDAVFLPAAVTGAIASTPGGGTLADAVCADLAAALRLLPTGPDSDPHLIVGIDCAKRLSLMPEAVGSGRTAFPQMTLRGGTIANLPTLVSETLVNDVVLIDPACFIGATGEVALHSSDQAALKLATDPAMTAAAGSPPLPVQSSVVSMFQTNSRAVLVERAIGFERVRPAVVRIANVTWGMVGSPPA